MRSPLEFIADTWSGLSHKAAMDAPDSSMVPSWVGTHWRRLTAYILLEALFSNSARHFLHGIDAEERRRHREYGDAALLVDTVRQAVMGEEISLVIPGMDDKDKEAQDRLAWLEQWADDEDLASKMLETERDTVKLGDGVIVILPNEETGRPNVRLYEAGFYFPDLDPDRPEDEFPRGIHIAWEREEPDGNGGVRRRVRRMSFRLRLIQPAQPGSLLSREVLRQGDVREARSGRILRQYPWNDKPSPFTCYMTDGWWDLPLKEGVTMDTPDAWGAPAEFAIDQSTGRPIDNLDLEMDFIPVIHRPNTVAIKGHYGASILLAVAQALDELAAADTDAAQAAALAGVPMVGASGIGAKEVKVKPGAVLNLGPNGHLDVLDLSASLAAIMAYLEALQGRITVNARVSDAMLGRIQPGEIKSGLHFALMFGPMRSLLQELRLVRKRVNVLVPKFAQRIAMSRGWLDGPVQKATIAYGSALPTDKAEVIDIATKLYAAHLLSRHEALKMLVDEGIIDLDIEKEIKTLVKEDLDRALLTFEALGADEAAKRVVYELLGIERPDVPEPVPPVNPAAPVQGAAQQNRIQPTLPGPQGQQNQPPNQGQPQ